MRDCCKGGPIKGTRSRSLAGTGDSLSFSHRKQSMDIVLQIQKDGVKQYFREMCVCVCGRGRVEDSSLNELKTNGEKHWILE